MLATFISLVLCAAALAQQAPYDIRRGDDLSRLKTFGFRAGTPNGRVSEETTTYDSPLIDERTKAAIAAQLERRRVRLGLDLDLVRQAICRQPIDNSRRPELFLGLGCGR